MNDAPSNLAHPASPTPRQHLLVHPQDDMVVALTDLAAGTTVALPDKQLQLPLAVPAKHKFSRRAAAVGERLTMYGQVVAEATRPITCGELLTTENVRHATDLVSNQHDNGTSASWNAPDVSRWQNRTFQGYLRPDGSVGTRNYWLVIPLVFCQNRNVDVLREALVDRLGYARQHRFHAAADRLLAAIQQGATTDEIRSMAASHETDLSPDAAAGQRPFPHVDGVKFLTHDGGCGGLYEDARTLCGLLAGYINHPNVAGATVLSLGCQKSQIETLQAELAQRNPDFAKPLYIFDQQREGTEDQLLDKALRHTLSGIMQANRLRRTPASLSHLTLGVECGGSDGFSGLSANPAIGHCADLLVALGGSVVLSEFPELAGCEADLMGRCTSPELAERFLTLMRDYDRRAVRDGGGFDQNPSPGNVRDGLITDAIKSAGAAKKGGSSPVVDVLDYPGWVTRPGLNLLCTPGGDVESTTAKAGAGANVQIFSTGLGTPTGNPISPVLKTSTNSPLAQRMPDIIDLDAGPIVLGAQSIAEVGEAMLELLIQTASGTYHSRAEQLGQDDFIPWKRGITF